MPNRPRLARALGDFLRARRAELDPAEIGLPMRGARRRVPGLRREEVAQLAAISHDYYARLEQGRITPSRSVLNALSDVLRLDNEQRTYLSELARMPAPGPAKEDTQFVRPQLQRLLDAMTTVPAFVFDQRLDILAWNSLATAVYIDFSLVPEQNRNYVHLMFADSEFRARYVDWDGAARNAVASLRRSAANNPDDLRLTELVDEISRRNVDFRKWWAAHEVTDMTTGTTVIRHPVAGDLTLDWDTYVADFDKSLRLMTMTAPVGSATHQSIQFLSSWNTAAVLGS